jgi:3-oxoacyl-[acyl-carrier protein] reductase
MDVKNKVVIITGSSSGIGAEAAVQLAALGARVVINYANSRSGAEQTLERVRAAGSDGLVVQADVCDNAQCVALVQAAVDAFGQLDILINNAGTTTHLEHKALDQLSDEIWQAALSTNLMGPFYMSRAALPEIAKQGGGEIVMTSSIAGLTTNGSSIAYCASKAAVNSLTRTLAKVAGEHKVRVNAICPGLIDGSWGAEGWGENWEDIKALYTQSTPLGAVSTPGEAAEGIIAVITGSDLMTGQLITIDSGFTL